MTWGVQRTGKCHGISLLGKGHTRRRRGGGRGKWKQGRGRRGRRMKGRQDGGGRDRATCDLACEGMTNGNPCSQVSTQPTTEERSVPPLVPSAIPRRRPPLVVSRHRRGVLIAPSSSAPRGVIATTRRGRSAVVTSAGRASASGRDVGTVLVFPAAGRRGCAVC